jgi:hypothetical protein
MWRDGAREGRKEWCWVEGKWLDEDNSHTRDYTQKRIPAVEMPATDITTHQFRFVNGELRPGPRQGD